MTTCPISLEPFSNWYRGRHSERSEEPLYFAFVFVLAVIRVIRAGPRSAVMF
jgi:hypothetical protein